jgi:hypothetical protein
MLVQNKDQKDYSLFVGHIEMPDSNQVIAVAIAFSEIPESIEVNSHSQKTILVQTFVNHTIPMSLTQIAAKVPELKVSVRETAKKVMDLSSKTLERHH